LHMLYSRGDFVEGVLKEVRTTLLLAMGLVVAVIFLFLRNLRATSLARSPCPPRLSALSPSCASQASASTICR